MKTDEIRRQIDQTNDRLGELNQQLAAQSQKAEEAQTAFIDGRAEMDNSLEEQQKLSLLQTTVQAVKNKINQLTATFTEVSKRENEQAQQKRRAEIVSRQNALKEQFAADFAIAAAELEKTVLHLAELRREYNSLCNEEQTISDARAFDYREITDAVKTFEHPFRESLHLALHEHNHRLERLASKERGQIAARLNAEREAKQTEAAKARAEERRQAEAAEAEKQTAYYERMKEKYGAAEADRISAN